MDRLSWTDGLTLNPTSKKTSHQGWRAGLLRESVNTQHTFPSVYSVYLLGKFQTRNHGCANKKGKQRQYFTQNTAVSSSSHMNIPCCGILIRQQTQHGNRGRVTQEGGSRWGFGSQIREWLSKGSWSQRDLSLTHVPINPKPARHGNLYSVHRRLPLC